MDLSLPRKHSPNGATADCGSGHLIAAYYSFIDPKRMKGRVGLVGWPIADDLPTSGDPSAVGRAQNRESSPVKDRRSTIVPCTQPKIAIFDQYLGNDTRQRRSYNEY